MKIGILSDTHGEVPATERAMDTLRRQNVDVVIHCGDVGAEIIPLLCGLPVHFVCGNVDDPDAMRLVIRESSHTLHEPLGTIEIEGRQIAFLHGDDVKLLRHTIHSGHWDLVCHGHTHAYSHARQGRTIVLNPGAVSRTNQPSVAVVDLPSMDIRQIPL